VFAEAKRTLDRLGHRALEMTHENAGEVDLAVSLGGDGTLLRALDMVVQRGVPVMGVNLGHLGYLAEVEPSEVDSALTRFFSGEYKIEERMTVAGQIRVSGGAEASSEFLALNEIVVERRISGHVIRVDVSLDGDQFLRYDADGLIVSSPTGSTAYSLSARGPIVAPLLRALIVTPITPHMLFDRALVLAPTSVIDLSLGEGPEASVMADGQTVARIEPGAVVTCRASEVTAHLVRLKDRDFHHILKSKFGLQAQ
jgi:NAD+ kinase